MVQNDDLTSFFDKFPDENSCRKYLEQLLWEKGKPTCPECGNKKKIYVYKSRNLYKCGNSDCHKQFKVTTGTIFQDSNLPLRKILLAYFLILQNKRGISSAQLGKTLGISQKSAWYLAHKIRKMMNRARSYKKLSGTVECDETYVGGKMKFGKTGRGSENKTPVFGMIERKGRLIIIPVPDAKRKTIEPLILIHVRKGTKVMTDEWWAYTKLSPYYKHETVKHRVHEYVRGNVHTNSIEGVWSHFKRSMRGTFFRPSRKHLGKYCAEFEFKFNNRNIDNFARLEKALLNSCIRVKQTDIN